MYEMKINGDVKNLLVKLQQITKELQIIPKNGNNMEYDYVQEKDVVEAVKAKFVEKNIALIPNIVDSSNRDVQLENGLITTIIKVVMSYTFFDIESGSYITTYFQGEGEDTLDKGIYKAITGCQKYLLLKTFQIGTGDDPEKGKLSGVTQNITESVKEVKASTPEPISNTPSNPEQIISGYKAKELFNLGKRDKKTIEDIISKYGYKTTFDVRYKHLSEIENKLKSIS